MRRYIQAALDDQARGNALPFLTMDKLAGQPVGSTRFVEFEYWSWAPDNHHYRPSVPDVVEIG